MAYTPTEWKTGDTITADLMNKLEQGVQNEQVGPAGIKGDTGAAAGFGTPTATVDANTGTPSVTITASGPDTAKVFAFEFKNLKGEKGDSGETYALSAATTSTLGGVKQAAAVADAAAAPTMEEFNGLLTALRNAGIIAQNS